jgi:hypothetical protein
MTSAAPDDATATFRLMYRSHSLIPDDSRKVELGSLFSQARSNNKKRGITGALLMYGDWFVQVLEGDETAVSDVFSRIREDPRHDTVSVLETGIVDARVFSRWAMARVDADDKPDVPLIAHEDGISPAAGRPTTPEQDRLLDVMRQAATSAAHVG